MQPNDNQNPYQSNLPDESAGFQPEPAQPDQPAASSPDFSLAQPSSNHSSQTPPSQPPTTNANQGFGAQSFGGQVDPSIEPTPAPSAAPLQQPHPQSQPYQPQPTEEEGVATPKNTAASPNTTGFESEPNPALNQDSFHPTPLSERELATPEASTDPEQVSPDNNSTPRADDPSAHPPTPGPETTYPAQTPTQSPTPSTEPHQLTPPAPQTSEPDATLHKQGFGTYVFPAHQPPQTPTPASTQSSEGELEAATYSAASSQSHADFTPPAPTPAASHPTPEPINPLAESYTPPHHSTPTPANLSPPQPAPPAPSSPPQPYPDRATANTNPATEAVPNPQEPTKQGLLNHLSQKFSNGLKNAHSKVKNEGFKAHLKPFLSVALISGLIYMLFNSQIILGQIQYLTSSGVGDPLPAASEIVSNEAAVTDEPRIVIPKINVNTPVVYDYDHPPGDPFNEDAVQKALEDGVVHYGTTARPGQNGNSVIVGHSSNNWWASGDYKFAFVLLDRLEEGDTFSVHYNSQRYVYEVYNIKVVEPTEVSVLRQTEDPIITLITCTPPGTSWKRLVVQARQISPDPATNEDSSADQVPEQHVLPSDGGSALEGLRSWFSRD